MRQTRLDNRLVSDGLVPTRSRARDLIQRGFVAIDGIVCVKPAQSVQDGAALSLSDAAPAFVSRGAEKLAAALDHFDIDVRGRTALDVGASTGGFTQILLQRGAAKVFAVDVGHSQLHQSLASNARVVARENCDARTLTRTIIPDAIHIVVADVSFISLTKVLAAPLALTGPGAALVVLVKPQFEVGRGNIAAGGIVRDEAARAKAVSDVSSWIASQPGWHVDSTIPSPILGGSGNTEYLIGAHRDA